MTVTTGGDKSQDHLLARFQRKVHLFAGHKWWGLVPCYIFPAVTASLFHTCFALWVLPWVNEFDVPRSTVMSGFAIGILLMGVVAPLVGRSFDFVSVRFAVIGGGLALAAGFFLAAISHQFWQILAAYAILMALGTTFAGLLPAQTVAIRLFPDKPGMMTGLAVLSTSVGAVIMPPLMAAVLQGVGWRSTFLIAGAMVLLIVIPAALCLPKAQAGKTPAFQKTPGEAILNVGDPAGSTMRSALRRKSFWIPIMAVLPVAFATGSIAPNLAAITSDAGIGLATVGYLIALMAGSRALGSVTIGWIADRVDYRIVFAAIAAAIAISLLLLGTPNIVVIAGAIAIVGFASGGASPLLGVMVVRGFGAGAYARILGLMTPFIMLGVAGPVFAAWIRDRTGSYDMAFVVCAALLALTAAAIFGLRTTSVKPRDAIAEPRT